MAPPALITSAAGESILKPRFRHDSLSPCGQVCSPMLLTQSNAFQCRNNPKTTPSTGGSGHPPYTWFRRSTRVHKANGISIRSAVVVGLMAVSNRHTDRPRYNCNNQTASLHPVHAMRPKRQVTKWTKYISVCNYTVAVTHRVS